MASWRLKRASPLERASRLADWRTRRLGVLRVVFGVFAVAVVLYGAAQIRGSGSAAISHVPGKGKCHYVRGGRDLGCTPGALNPDVTINTLSRTICRRGWTRTVRPSVEDSGRAKGLTMDAYGARGGRGGYEYDHLVPLELGGAPADGRNLWPEPIRAAHRKDLVENRFRRLVCAHRMPLHLAQARFLRWGGP